MGKAYTRATTRALPVDEEPLPSLSRYPGMELFITTALTRWFWRRRAFRESCFVAADSVGSGSMLRVFIEAAILASEFWIEGYHQVSTSVCLLG